MEGERMKRNSLLVTCLLACSSLCLAEDFKAGAHGAYSLGGHVEDQEFGVGLHLGAAVNDFLTLELAGTWFREEYKQIGAVTTVALSARYSTYVAEGTGLYFGVGPNMNFYGNSDFDTSIGYHLAFGAELAIADLFEFIAEYRYSIVHVEAERADDFSYRFGLVRLGGSYWF